MRRTLAALSSLALAVTLAAPVGAAPSQTEEVPGERTAGPLESVATRTIERSPRDDGLGTGDEPRGYLVRLEDEPVATYDGDTAGFARTRRAEGEQAGDRRVERTRYADRLASQQEGVISRSEREFGRDLDVRFQYQYAVNGFAVTMTPAEARRVATQDGVADVKFDGERELQTDQGPGLIGATTVWQGSGATGLELDDASVRGEGVIVGIIDSGINPGNPSFLDLGDPDTGSSFASADSYDFTNPFGEGSYVGVCDSSNPEQYDEDFPCNDKLIGAWSFVYNGPTGGALDDDGHGSHTGSTAAGNSITATITPTSAPPQVDFQISGVAPNANVISYMGCCTESGLTRSIEQAIIDGVDVINYSIGSSAPSNLFNDFDALGFLSARAEGIFVATSNGNDGPEADTTGSPSDAPWIVSVGASTHLRKNSNNLIDMTGGDTAPPADIAGVGVTGDLGPTPIVYAGDFGDPLCEYDGEPDDPADPDEIDNTANFTGKIVVCDRGVIGRVAKSFNVAAQGAVGFVLANDEPNGDSLSGDAFAIPGLHITFDDGVVLKTWLATGTGHTASISGTVFDISLDNADILAGFSSRGANRAAEVIVPDVIAPGVDVLAAYGASIPVQIAGTDPATTDYTLAEWDFLSGTSMASPHVAGLGALLTQARGAWSPAEMQSALMTTAIIDGVRDSDLSANPDAYQIGAGRVDVTRAVLAGLLFDETEADYLAANPDEGGDFKTLNLPSFNDQQCLETCSWDRSATSSAIGAANATVTWTPSFVSDAGLTLSLDQGSYVVASGAVMNFTVTADASGIPNGERAFGRITLTPDVAEIPTITMPVAIHASNGVLPEALDVIAQRDAGSELLRDLIAIDITTFDGDVLGLVEADVRAGLVTQDTQPGGGAPQPYDNLDDSGVDTYFVDVPADTARLVTEILETSSPDIDLFVGIDLDGEGDVDADEEIASSASGGSFEIVDLPGPDAGTYWILVQNWAASAPPPAQDPYLLSIGIVPNVSLGNADITAPNNVPKKTEFDARFSWDLPDSQPGDLFYGVARLGSDTGQAGDIGTIPVSLLRVDDDVTKTASRSRVEPGETVTYTVEIAVNQGNEDLTYTISDTLPDGMTYVEGSASIVPSSVAGQTLTFDGILQETTFGKPVDYIASTNATNPACPADGYLDLYGLAGIQPDPEADGDSFAIGVSQGVGPFPFYAGSTGLFAVTDDGVMATAEGFDPNAAYFLPQELPDPSSPNAVIAPLWSDLEFAYTPGTTPGTESGITVAQNGISVLIEYDDPFEWTPDDSVGPSVGDFEIQYYNYVDPTFPEILFHYGELGALPAEATIGIENLLGDKATTFLNLGDPSSLLTANSTLCLDLLGPELAPVVITYDAVVDNTVPFATALTNQLVSTTDDPAGQAATTSATVQVFPNSAPAFTASSGNFAQTVATGESLAPVTATDADGDDLVYSVVAGTLPAGIELLPDGSFQGSVEPQQQGTYTVTIAVTDDSGASDTTTLVITVTNAAPVASDDTATTDTAVPVEIAVLDNDSDIDGDALTVSGVTAPGQGSVTCDDTTCTYTSEVDFFGVDTFDYTVSDGNGGSDTATVTVTVEEVIVEPTPTEPTPTEPTPTEPTPTEPTPTEPTPTEPTPTEPTPTEPEQDLTPTRVAGADRFATSLQLSQLGWEDGSADTAILVRGDEYPDALAGVTMGAAYDAPVLQNPNDTLRDDVAAELERLGVATVIVLGGELAISSDVTDVLEEDYDVVRLAGENRFATAAKILETLTDPALVSSGESRYDQAIVTLGIEPAPDRDGWVDALGAGTMATTGIPVVLTRKDSLPTETADALTAGVVEGGTVYVLGGPVAVSNDVVAAIATLGFEVERVAGETRYGTSVAAVEAAVDLGASLSTAIVASGRNYPDALSGAVAAWKLDGFLMLVEPTDLDGSPETRDYLVDNADSINRVYVAGGPVAITDAVVDQLATALGVR